MRTAGALLAPAVVALREALQQTAILPRMKPQQWPKKYPLITMVATYVAITLLAGPVLANSLGADVAWTALAAVATVGALLLLVPYVLGWGCTGEALKDPWLRKALRWVALCAVVGLVLNAAALVLTNGGEATASTAGPDADPSAAQQSITFTIWDADGNNGASVATNPAAASSGTASQPLDMPARVALLVACCFATAVFEEGFFRGLVVPCAANRTRLEIEALQKGDVGGITRDTYNQMTEEEKAETTNVPYSAAVFSGLLFGVVHIMSGTVGFADASLAVMGLMVVEGIAKAVQAGMFGYVMAAFMLRSRSVFGPMVVHFLFDLLYFAPVVLATAALPDAYITGSWVNVVLLVLTSVALVPAVRVSSAWLKGRSILPSHEQN